KRKGVLHAGHPTTPNLHRHPPRGVESCAPGRNPPAPGHTLVLRVPAGPVRPAGPSAPSHHLTKEGQAMFYRTESRPQGWRALAVFDDGAECLLFVGRSTTHVRAGYPAAFAEVLEVGERARVRRPDLQCWPGAAVVWTVVTEVTL